MQRPKLSSACIVRKQSMISVKENSDQQPRASRHGIMVKEERPGECDLIQALHLWCWFQHFVVYSMTQT